MQVLCKLLSNYALVKDVLDLLPPDDIRLAPVVESLKKYGENNKEFIAFLDTLLIEHPCETQKVESAMGL